MLDNLLWRVYQREISRQLSLAHVYIDEAVTSSHLTTQSVEIIPGPRDTHDLIHAAADASGK